MSSGAGIAAAAGIGAVGSIIGGNEQADAYKDAASAQIKMYEQTRADLEPYRDIGYAALGVLGQMFIPGYGATSDVDSQISDLESELESLTRGASAPTLRRVGGLGPSDNLQEQHDRSRGRVSRPSSGSNTARIEELRGRLDQLRGQRAGISASPPSAPDYSAFYKSPGYEFRFDEGARAVGRGASARGRRLGGAHERELIRYGQGVASSEFNSYANRLASLAGLGQTSAAQTGQAGAQAASSQGAYLAGEGTARASGYVGAANAATSGIGNYLFYAGLQNQG